MAAYRRDPYQDYKEKLEKFDTPGGHGDGVDMSASPIHPRGVVAAMLPGGGGSPAISSRSLERMAEAKAE